ncbi:MAG: hypothetical protein GY749_48155 [Desulfobacteraceae bacterium]|nr:hypothetical protein [Desulfobacteraceae bacterium]
MQTEHVTKHRRRRRRRHRAEKWKVARNDQTHTLTKEELNPLHTGIFFVQITIIAWIQQRDKGKCFAVIVARTSDRQSRKFSALKLSMAVSLLLQLFTRSRLKKRLNNNNI